MIELTINNSYSKITGLPPKLDKELRSLLSYTENPDAAYYGRGYARQKSLISKYGEFPTGLLYLVTGFIKGLPINLGVTTKDARKRPISSPRTFKLNLPVIPYPDQINAVTELTRHTTAGCVMPTGSGKSITMALLIQAKQLKTLVIVPTVELKRQLSETFEELFGSLQSITVENIDSPNLQKSNNYDMLLLDECHRSAAKTYRNLNKKYWGNIYHRYFFSATFFRNDPEEQLLFESIAGQAKYELTIPEAISKNIIVPIESYYIEVPKKQTDAFTWREVYSELVVNNVSRNKQIVDMLKALNEKYTLCLVREVKHGKILSELTGIPFVHGSDNESRQYIEQFSLGKIKQLIGTVGIMSEGIDTKPCEYVIIAGAGKAKSQFMQSVGRSVRRYPGKESAKVIIFRDTSHKYVLRHFNQERKILLDTYYIPTIKLA